MKPRSVKLLCWTLCGLLIVGEIVYLLSSDRTLKVEEAWPSLWPGEISGRTPVDQKYQPLIIFPFTKRKPIENKHKVAAPKMPYEIVRIVANKVQLMHRQTGAKRFYKIPEDIYEGVQPNLKKVGRLNSIRREGSRLLIEATYKGKDFTLEFSDADAAQHYIKQFVAENNNRRILPSTDYSKLEDYEGRKVSDTEYELNWEFFNAIMDNAVFEADKIRYTSTGENLSIASLGKQSILRKLGFETGDTLVSFDGNNVNAVEQLMATYQNWIKNQKPVNTFKVKRDGKVLEYKVTILSNKGKFAEKFKRQK